MSQTSAWSLISTQTFRRALTASVDSCAGIKSTCPFSGITKSGRVWRKVPESGARSVSQALTPEERVCIETDSDVHALCRTLMMMMMMSCTFTVHGSISLNAQTQRSEGEGGG